MWLARLRDPLSRLALVLAILAVSGREVLACSGPGVASEIFESQMIGLVSVGLSFALVIAGGRKLGVRSLGHRVFWLIPLLVMHPFFWISAVQGDCGMVLSYMSIAAVLFIAAATTLAVLWPGRSEPEPKPRRLILAGAIAGGLAGFPIGVLMGNPMLHGNPALAGLVMCSTVAAGILLVLDRIRLRARGGPRFRLSVRTLVLLPLVVSPLLVALFPVLPYEGSCSTMAPFRFVVVNDATDQPIAGAVVQVVDPRYRRDDPDKQSEKDVTELDGSTEYLLSANIYGRQGLFGRRETITYAPQTIHVEAPGYRPFIAALADGDTTQAATTTDPPLRLTFPPPPSVTVRLKEAKQEIRSDVPKP